MAKQITQFAADDGQLFETEEAADAHSRAIKTIENVAKFSQIVGLEKPQVALLTKLMPAYLDYVEHGVIPAKLEKKERKPRAPKAAPTTPTPPEGKPAAKKA